MGRTAGELRLFYASPSQQSWNLLPRRFVSVTRWQAYKREVFLSRDKNEEINRWSDPAACRISWKISACFMFEAISAQIYHLLAVCDRSSAKGKPESKVLTFNSVQQISDKRVQSNTTPAALQSYCSITIPAAVATRLHEIVYLKKLTTLILVKG